jgi:hypothetical protein
MTEDEILAAADAILVERVKPLAFLWDKTRTDWALTMDWTLTEPVCPFAYLSQESSKEVKFGYWADAPIASMLKSIEAATKALENCDERW